MNKEFYRMQKLAGIITESQYKEKIEEGLLSDTLKKIGDKISSIPIFDKLIDNIISNMSDEDIDNFKSKFNLNETMGAPSLENIFSKIHSANPDKDLEDTIEDIENLNETLEKGTFAYKVVNLIRNITGINIMSLGGIPAAVPIAKILTTLGMSGFGAMFVGPLISLFASLIILKISWKLLGRTGSDSLVGDH